MATNPVELTCANSFGGPDQSRLVNRLAKHCSKIIGKMLKDFRNQLPKNWWCPFFLSLLGSIIHLCFESIINTARSPIPIKQDRLACIYNWVVITSTHFSWSVAFLLITTNNNLRPHHALQWNVVCAAVVVVCKLNLQFYWCGYLILGLFHALGEH